jgi:hypothetical protein
MLRSRQSTTTSLKRFPLPPSQATSVMSRSTPKTPTAASDSGMRAAVALNNMGLTLLKRNCHKEAMTTLKDALDMMGSLCSEARVRQRLTLDDQATFLAQACQRVAQSTPSLNGSPDQPMTLSQMSSPHEISATIDHLPCSQASCTVQIVMDGSETDADLTASTMLLNLSVACRQSALMGKKGEKRSRLFHRAYQCAFLANTILSRSVEALDDDAKLEHALVISVLVFHELFQLASVLGYKEDARLYHNELCDHRFIWKKSEEAFLLWNHCEATVTMAAAA